MSPQSLIVQNKFHTKQVGIGFNYTGQSKWGSVVPSPGPGVPPTVHILDVTL